MLRTTFKYEVVSKEYCLVVFLKSCGIFQLRSQPSVIGTILQHVSKSSNGEFVQVPQIGIRASSNAMVFVRALPS